MRTSLALLLFLAPSALAHPVPRDAHDRAVVVTPTPAGLLIDYRVEADEFTAQQDLAAADADLSAIRLRSDLHALYLKTFNDYAAASLSVTLDGRELPLRLVESRYYLLDHVRCDRRYLAAWNITDDAPRRLRVYEGAFAGERAGTVALVLAASPAFAVDAEAAPTEDASTDAARRTLTATLRMTPSQDIAAVKIALPPPPDETRPGATGRDRRRAAVAKPGRGEGTARADGPDDDPQIPPADDLLSLLLDTDRGFVVLLLLAALFGAAHALTPGHGKTMVAAYLVGERGTVVHALALGLTTTLTHTGSVMLIAGVLPIAFGKVPPATTQAVLGLAGGLMIAAMGMWLLLQRLTGRADHVHLDENMGREPETWLGVIVLGVAGGLVPCWDAIALLLWSMTTNRLWLGLPLLLAFSAGLAAVLVALGIAVVKTKGVVRDRVGGDRFDRLTRALPLVSAAAVAALGVWMCYESARQPGAFAP